MPFDNATPPGIIPLSSKEQKLFTPPGGVISSPTSSPNASGIIPLSAPEIRHLSAADPWFPLTPEHADTLYNYDKEQPLWEDAKKFAGGLVEGVQGVGHTLAEAHKEMKDEPFDLHTGARTGNTLLEGGARAAVFAKNIISQIGRGARDMIPLPSGLQVTSATEKYYQRLLAEQIENRKMRGLPDAKPADYNPAKPSFILPEKWYGNAPPFTAAADAVSLAAPIPGMGAAEGMIKSAAGGVLKRIPSAAELATKLSGKVAGAAEAAGRGVKNVAAYPGKKASEFMAEHLPPEAVKAVQESSLAGLARSAVNVPLELGKVAGRAVEMTGAFARHLAETTPDSIPRLVQLANKAEAPSWIKKLAGSLHDVGAGTVVQAGRDVLESAGHGAVSGAALGLASGKPPEEVGQFAGAGVALGSTGRAISKVSGADAKMRAQRRSLATTQRFTAHALAPVDKGGMGLTPEQLGKIDNFTAYTTGAATEVLHGDVTFSFLEPDAFAAAAAKTSEPGSAAFYDPDTKTIVVQLGDKTGRLFHELPHRIARAAGADGEARLLIDSIFSPEQMAVFGREYAQKLVDAELAASGMVAGLASRAGMDPASYAQLVDAKLKRLNGQPGGEQWLYDEIYAEAGYAGLLSRDIGKIVGETAWDRLGAKVSAPLLEALGAKTEPGDKMPGFTLFSDPELYENADLRKMVYEHLRKIQRHGSLAAGGKETKEGLPKDAPRPRLDLYGKHPAVPMEPNPSTGRMENDAAVKEPSGEVTLRKPSEVRRIEKTRQEATKAAFEKQPVKPAGDATPETAPRQTPEGVETTGTKIADQLPPVFGETARQNARLAETLMGTGGVMDIWYQAIGTGAAWYRDVKRRLGNISASKIKLAPFLFKVSKEGNVLLVGLSLTAADRKMAKWQASGKLDELWGGDAGLFRADLMTYLQNHAADRAGDVGLNPAKKNALNVFVIGDNKKFADLNPLRGKLAGEDAKGVIRSLRIDRMGEAVVAPETGWHPEYEKKKFNLSPAPGGEQLGEKPGFKEWFRNSKVVDDSGRPLVVYHLAKEPVDVLDSGKAKSDLSSIGIHFGSAAQAEKRFSQYDFKGEKANTIPVFLSLQNPLEVSHMASFAPDHLADVMMDLGILNEAQFVKIRDKYSEEWQVGAQLKKILERNGYDGLKYANEREGAGFSYVPFRPEQSKSAIGNKGTFDPKDKRINFSPAPESDETPPPTGQPGGNLGAPGANLNVKDSAQPINPGGSAENLLPELQARSTINQGDRAAMMARLDEIKAQRAAGGKQFSPAVPGSEANLVGVHNLSEENLAHALKLGGLAVPSIAITRPDKAGFEGFGEISLVASKELITPSRETKVLNADAYSPRYPTVHYFLDQKARDVFGKLAEDAIKQLPPAAQKSFSRYNLFNEMPEKTVRESLARSEEARLMYLAEAGKIPKKFSKAKDVRYQQGQDRSVINQLFNSNSPEFAAFEKWVDDLVTRLGVNETEKIFNGYTNLGKRSYVPHTLDNVVRNMKKGFRDAEGFNYGPGSVRAVAAKQFRSLKEIHASRDKIVSLDDLEKLKEDIYRELTTLADEAMAQWRTNPIKGFGRYDAFSDDLKALAQGGAKNWQYLREQYPGGEPFEKMRAFLDKLRDMPTEYFEAKPRRAVQLQEFAGAVLPDTVKPATVAALEKHGLEVVQYPKGNAEARRKAVLELSQRRNVNFSPNADAGYFFRHEAEEPGYKIPASESGEELAPAGATAHYWLSPSGRFYDANGYHRLWAVAHVTGDTGDSVQRMQRNGWTRVNTSSEDRAVYIEGPMNKAQRAALEELAFHREQPVFDDSGQIAIESSREFEDKGGDYRNFSPAPDSGPPQGDVWYSQLQRVIEEKMPERAPVGHVRNLLDPAKGYGVKAEEVKWTGLDDWLAKQNGSVTKKDVLDYLKENNLEVQEVVKGGERAYQLYGEWDDLTYAFEDYDYVGEISASGENDSKPLITLFQKGDDIYLADPQGNAIHRETNFKTLDEAKTRGLELAEEIHRDNLKDEPNGTKHGDDYLVLPGGENYREILFTLPENKEADWKHENTELNLPLKGGGYAVAPTTRWTANINGSEYQITFNPHQKHYRLDGEKSGLMNAQYPTLQEAFDAAVKGTDYKHSGREVFRGSHWDEPNVLAHARVNDRTDTTGAKLLFGEEFQSDWHREGRKEGYATKDSWQKATKFHVEDLEGGGFAVVDEHGRAWVNATGRGRAIERMNELNERGIEAGEKTVGVPDAPFKNTWHEMVFRRLVRVAAEGGYDKLAWTTGEQQIDRYDLGKQVDSIRVGKEADNRFEISATKDRKVVILKGGLSGDDLANHIGKDLAGKALKQLQGDKTVATYEGIDLKVGGEGKKRLYDKMLVDYANKFGKKFGAKVEDASINTGKSIAVLGSDKDLKPVTPAEARAALSRGEPVYGARPAEFGINYNLLEIDDPARTMRVWVGSSFFIPKSKNVGGEAVHSLPITPEMKKSVLQGQPLFSPVVKGSGIGPGRQTQKTSPPQGAIPRGRPQDDEE